MINQGEHILTLDGYFDESLIDQILDEFAQAEERGLTLNRNEYMQSDITTQKDSSVFYSSAPSTVIGGVQKMVDTVNQDVLDMFLEQYPVIQSGNYKELYVSNCKVQKTCPSGGYHNWHSEHTNDLHSKETLLAWMVYLNDVEDGGETEFLYQSLRVKPIRNRLVLWPAGFTHLHRGNPPLKGDKYIVTGWINFI